jgi:NAD(P)H dehydrogenase (quinone)
VIAVTGASGRVGRRVAELLAAEGRTLRLLARDPGRAPRLPGAEAAAASYEDPAGLLAALAGADVLFLVSIHGEPGARARLHAGAIDAAAGAGVRHLVYLSFQGASPDSAFPYSRDHALTEAHLRGSGLPFTVLRDCLYLDLLPEMFGADGVVRGPAGEGRAAWVAREDVARAAAAVLRDPAAHEGAAYDVTGPEALTLAEAAARLSALAGRPLRYEDEPLDEARRWRLATGARPWQVEAWVGSYRAIAAGELAPVSDAVARLTGRPPLGLEACFRGSPGLLDALRPGPGGGTG